MGRRDAVQFTLEYAAEARRLGAIVDFYPGWERRGNGTSANYEGSVVHHTVGNSSPAVPFPSEFVLRDGRLDLPGPLTNVAGPWCPPDKPKLIVMAAHPSNNAGASGGRGTAPFPVTRLFNPLVWALEIDYLGTVPMVPGQYLSALIHSRATINVLRKSPDWCKAHAETSVTGKWDPGFAPGKTIDMAAFRSNVAALGAPKPTPIEEDELADSAVVNAIRSIEQMSQSILRQLGLEKNLTPGPDYGKVTVPGWKQLGTDDKGRPLTVVDALARMKADIEDIKQHVGLDAPA